METSIKQLVSLIAQLAKSACDSGLIVPREKIFFNWELQDFSYTEKGVEYARKYGKETVKKDWVVSTRKLSREISTSSEFSNVEKQIKKNYNSTNPSDNLRMFCNAIFPIYLDNPRKENKKAVEKVIVRFLRDLKQEPAIIGATFNVSGLVLKSKKIKIDKNIFIRQVEKKDLEIPLSISLCLISGQLNQNVSYHSILEIRLPADRSNMNEIKTTADKYIALLRLFKVGSVRYLSYQMISDVLLSPFSGGTITSGNTDVRKEIYLIKKNEENLLRKFLTKLPIPEHVYSRSQQEKKFDHLSIAFDRYSEALTENTFHGRRITNIVIGLEALFSTDSIELKFKLSNRISKILSFFNYNPLTVKNIISLGYDVRSKFSHGEHLDEKLKVKIEKECQNIDEFSMLLNNYLRICLITMLVVGKTKKDYISIVDEALIDDIKNKELKVLLKKAAPFRGVFANLE